MALSGTANADVASVTWTNDRGGSGTATGAATWSDSTVALLEGVNVITVTGHGSVNDAIDVITVTLDTVAPTIQITGPTSSPTYSTSMGTVTLSGVAADSSTGVSFVTWSCTESGFSGTFGGSTSWSGLVSLILGTNTVVVTATDGAGNTATDTITITLSSTAAFPTTSIIYTGTGANQDPLGSGVWAGPVFTIFGHLQLKRASNKIVGNGTPGVDRASSYWIGTTSSPARDEVFCTLSTISTTDGGSLELYIRLVNAGSDSARGYAVRIAVASGGETSQYLYRRYDPSGGIVNLGGGQFTGPSLSNGAMFGASMDGALLKMYINQGSGWAEVDAGVFDNTYPLGTGTIGLRVDPAELSVVDFGGANGTVPSPSPTYGPVASGAW